MGMGKPNAISGRPPQLAFVGVAGLARPRRIPNQRRAAALGAQICRSPPQHDLPLTGARSRPMSMGNSELPSLDWGELEPFRDRSPAVTIVPFYHFSACSGVSILSFFTRAGNPAAGPLGFPYPSKAIGPLIALAPSGR